MRILIVRLSALGDLVFATTLLHGLKARWPDAEVDWLVQPEFAGFLATQGAIAAVHPWPRKEWGVLLRAGRWLALVQAVLALRRRLRARDYELVIDAQGLAKSRALAWLAGGRRRVGYASKEPLGFLLHERVARPNAPRPYTDKAIALEHRALIAHLTGTPGPAPVLEIPRADAAPVADASVAAGAATVAEVPAAIALAPFTTRPQKHWPEAHWAALIQALAARGEKMTLLGGPADAAAAQRILDLAGAVAAVQVRNRVGTTSLPAAAACIGAAKAVIGVDTGLTHMGVATARPTVALFGSTVPYRTGGRGPLAVLWLGLACSPCRRHPTCGGRFDCLVDTSPQQVLRALDAVLAEAADAADAYAGLPAAMVSTALPGPASAAFDRP